ncbi:MAG: NTF2-like N-terminal transpeptidase domain-containing protein, partial [Candidatus Promineifilaceae bacterium]
MTRIIVLLLLFVFITSACSDIVLPMTEDEVFPTTTGSNGSATPDRPTIPTKEPIEEDAGGYALAFYNAFENQDYLGMYSLLSPQSQALVDSDSFVERYDEAVKTAGVQSIHAQPLSLTQDGDQAEFGVRVTWETAVVGPITREY